MSISHPDKADMINLEVDHGVTIQHLQEIISAQFPFPVNCDKLCNKDTLLNDKSQTLEQVGINEDDRLVVPLASTPAQTIQLPGPETPFQVRGLREVCEVGDHQFWRLRGTSQWQPYKPDSPAPISTQNHKFHLSIVLHQQASGRNHWVLFLAKEGEKGDILEVKGDAEFMRYAPSTEPVNPVTLEGYVTSYDLATISDDQVAVVREVAGKETPPSAPNRRMVKENCQGWVVRVMGQLVARGIIPSHKLDMAKRLQEPIELPLNGTSTC